MQIDTHEYDTILTHLYHGIREHVIKFKKEDLSMHPSFYGPYIDDLDDVIAIWTADLISVANTFDLYATPNIFEIEVCEDLIPPIILTLGIESRRGEFIIACYNKISQWLESSNTVTNFSHINPEHLNGPLIDIPVGVISAKENNIFPLIVRQNNPDYIALMLANEEQTFDVTALEESNILHITINKKTGDIDYFIGEGVYPLLMKKLATMTTPASISKKILNKHTTCEQILARLLIGKAIKEYTHQI